MSRKKQRSKQFREEACKLVSEQGYSVRHAARELDIPRNTLWNWLTENGQFTLSEQELEQTIGNDPAALKIRIKELQERIRRLEMEKEILKKATAYFAKDSL